jgi:hypothetical protein
MVQGVAFFGPPFQGSRNADLMAPIASLLGTITSVRSSFVNDMRTSSRELPVLTMTFNNIITEEHIDIVLFVEKNPDGLSKVV